MARNLARDARLSKLHAESIRRRTTIALLLYGIATRLAIWCILLFGLEHFGILASITEIIDGLGLGIPAKDLLIILWVLIEVQFLILYFLFKANPDVLWMEIVKKHKFNRLKPDYYLKEVAVLEDNIQQAKDDLRDAKEKYNVVKHYPLEIKESDKVFQIDTQIQDLTDRLQEHDDRIALVQEELQEIQDSIESNEMSDTQADARLGILDGDDSKKGKKKAKKAIKRLQRQLKKAKKAKKKQYKKTKKLLKREKKSKKKTLKAIKKLERCRKAELKRIKKIEKRAKKQKKQVEKAYVKQYAFRLKQAKNALANYRTRFRRNRYEKNRYAEFLNYVERKYLHSRERIFQTISVIFVLLFFVFVVVNSLDLGMDTSIWQFMDSGKDDKFYYIQSCLWISIIMHFICGICSGRVTRVALWDHDIAYQSVENAEYEMDVDDYTVRSSFALKNHVDVPGRWDGTNALLEERPREYPVTMFFMRNLFQTIFTLSFAGLYIYLVPAFMEISKSDSSFGIIFTVLQWVLFVMMTFFLCRAFSFREYEYDCMDENLQSWRGRYILMLVFFVLAIIIGMVFMLIGDIEGFVDSVVYARMLISLIFMFLFAIFALLTAVFMFPRDRKKDEKDVFMFFKDERHKR